jgi:hypothetical protein
MSSPIEQHDKESTATALITDSCLIYYRHKSIQDYRRPYFTSNKA